MPKTLYLQKEFCGLEPGTPFELVEGDAGEAYQHRGFLIQAEEASENEDWFATTRPRAARAAAVMEHDDED